ncbi:uncharacterized protein [Dysidea avara]|uniref:uncharacterized protein isoform X3 n=1 Tax=Dysidea avara TaxID=196820 RepID=UPI00331CCAD4
MVTTSNTPISTPLLMPTSTNVLSVPVSISSNTMVQSADAFTKVSTTAESTALLGCTEPSTANNKNDHRLQRSPEMDYIPDGWRSKMSPAEQQWIGEALFKSKNRIKDGALSTLWWYPPPVKMVTGRKPQPDVYAMHRLCVWMPLMAWNVVFKCPTCRLGTLTSKGVYKKTIRSVVDYTNHYYLTTEELQCNNKPCEKTFLGWDERLLSQLSTRRISQFPAILTKKRACDVSVVACLRDRTLGNSSTALYNRVQEQHTEEWMKRAVMYYADCEEYSKGMTGLQIMTSFVIDKPLPIEKIGGASWFLKVYAKDILKRLPQILATCTAVFGSVLKIDSTKKVCRKLQGRAAGTASWCTNVGNERGEILTSVLTESEGLDGLRPMAVGLIRRYEKAKQDPPKLLYTDRDCCSIRGRSHCAKLFNEWENLVVRLDIWHYMRRLSRVCTSESHPIYGKFMASLSDVIFEWDEADYSRLCDAKRGYLKQQGISQPSVSAVKKAITKDELSRHCRRKTRGVELTIQLIEELLLKLGTATDSVGVPLFNEDMTTIWEEQKKHVPCIQDPPGMCLYTITGYIMKGGVRLPVYRCSRGTTSLESFHLHVARFIPGTSASDVHFQVYLLEGLLRWNQARERAAVQQQCKDLRTFNLELAYKVNRYSLTFHSSKLLPHHHAPMCHHEGEYFGVEYLFRQAGGTLPSMEEIEQNDKDDEDATEDNTDDGFVDENGISPIQEQDLLTNELNEELAGEQERDDDDDDEELDTTTSNSTEVISSSAAVDTTTSDTRGIPGWDKVGNLAKLLTELTGIAVSTHQAGQLKALYDALDDYDKQNIKVHLKTLPQLRGRFCRKKRPGNTHEELMSRSLLSGSPSPLGPKESRIVEAVCILLCQRHLDAGRSSGSGGCRRAYLPRWKLVLKDYNAIRSRLYHSWGVLEETNLALYHINRTTLRKWYQDNVRMEEVTSRLQGIQLPTPPLHSAVDIPAAQEYPVSIRTPPGPEHEFSEPEETLRQVRKTVTTSTNTGAANTNANPHLLVTTGPVIRVAPRVLCRVLATSTTNPTFTSAEGCTGTQLVPVVREVEVAVAPRTMSKTCEWREKRRQAEAAAGLDVPPPPKRRRPYCCAK